MSGGGESESAAVPEGAAGLEEAQARLATALAQDLRTLVVLAGSNGAGKSTFYDVYLSDLGLPFVNADLIAATLAIDDPRALAQEAGAVAERERATLLSRGESFCMETVFSDPVGAKLQLLRDARARGYVVVLIFIGLPSPELSALRVAQRTAAGGHEVPLDRIASRFPRTIANLGEALRFVDLAVILDNGSAEVPYRFVSRWEEGRRVRRSRLRPAWLPVELR